MSPPDGEFVHEPESDATRPSLTEQFDDIRDIAVSPSFVLLFLGLVLIYTTLYVLFVHFVVYTIDIGHSRTVGASIVAIIGLASTVGRVGIGFAGDSIGRIRIFVACSIVMGVAFLALPAAQTVPALAAFGLVYGLAYGGNGALLGPLVSDLFGRGNINAVFGLASASFAVSGLFAPYLAGVGHENMGTYDPVFVAAGLAAIAGAVAIVGAERFADAR